MIFCAQSAFGFWRTPPQVLAVLPAVPQPGSQGERMSFHDHPTVRYVLGCPFHTLVFDQANRTNAKYNQTHLWSGKLPAGALIEVGGIGTVTSPLFTLLTMAPSVTPVELAMAMYEFCGEFSVYNPPEEYENLTQRHTRPDEWSRVFESSGRPTSLWMRPALISIDDLRDFANSIKGMRGARTFREAAAMVLGVTRSPFEAQACLLLGSKRTQGGYGLSLRTNEVLRLDQQAKRLAQRDYCVADIYLESPDGTRCVDVECQGAAVHSSLGSASSDADRTTALESMGVSVVLMSYGQLVHTDRLKLVVELIAEKLGVKMAPKSARMVAAESKLRHQLFIDWRSLCGLRQGIA